jgi:hypothetical protein
VRSEKEKIRRGEFLIAGVVGVRPPRLVVPRNEEERIFSGDRPSDRVGGIKGACMD